MKQKLEEKKVASNRLSIFIFWLVNGMKGSSSSESGIGISLAILPSFVIKIPRNKTQNNIFIRAKLLKDSHGAGNHRWDRGVCDLRWRWMLALAIINDCNSFMTGFSLLQSFHEDQRFRICSNSFYALKAFSALWHRWYDRCISTEVIVVNHISFIL